MRIPRGGWSWWRRCTCPAAGSPAHSVVRMPTEPSNAALEYLSWLECAAAIRSDLPRMQEHLATGYRVTGTQREAFELVYVGVTTDIAETDHPVVVDQWLRLLAHQPETLQRRRCRWWSRVVLADADGRPVTDPVRIGPPLPTRVDVDAMRGKSTSLFVPVGVLMPAGVAGIGGIAVSLALPVNGVVALWIFAVCALVAGTAGYVVTARKDRQILAARPPLTPQRTTDAGARTEAWQQARERFDTVRLEYAAFETDPAAFFTRPLLADLTHPAVQRFHDAFAAANALYLEDERPPQDAELVYEFARRAAEAESTWRAADELARTTGDTRLNPEQQQLMRRASSLVNLALDEQAPAAERALAYRQVTDLFTTARIPTPTSITNGLRLQLEAAKLLGNEP